MVTKGEQTQRKIIEKSLQLFSAKGYTNTSIADILRQTELTKGGLYGHFQSKEEIWKAVYEEAITVWQGIVLNGTAEIADPLERIEKLIENNMKYYLGADVFQGGCFFVKMLVELSGQSALTNKPILQGFVRFSKLLQTWLKEADGKGMLKPGLRFREIANFIVICFNGAATLYSASKDALIWKCTINQLTEYVRQLRR